MSSLKYKQLREGDVYQDAEGRVRLHLGADRTLRPLYPPGSHRALVLHDPTGRLAEGVAYDFGGSSATLSEMAFKLLHRAPDPAPKSSREG